MTTLERFWTNVDRSGECWLWTGNLGCRYGRFRTGGGKRHIASRWIYEQMNGPLPEGRKVLHRCDNPACVRPDHLFDGTIADNNRDRDRKRRHARGDTHGMAKLTWPQVRAIRAATGTLRRALAEQFGVSITTIRMILNQQIWKEQTP